MRIFIGITALFFAGAAFAQTGMTADEFEETVAGKTFDFAANGTTYGREIYLPGNNVIWDDMQGETCRYGTWYPTDTAICFIYEDQPDTPKCWSILPEVDGQYIALFQNNPDNGRQYVMTESDAPMMCTGPEVGS